MDKETKDLVEVNNEKDLMAKDVLQMMMKLVIALVVSLLLVIGAFIGYAVYKDHQYNEFINSFEFEGETTETIVDSGDGGNAGFVGGNSDVVNNGEDSTQDDQN